MYLRKAEGPRAIVLPDGTILSQADLPPESTRRWVASRKATVVRGVVYGLISKETACRRYALSIEELEEWIHAASTHGFEALKATALQKFRNNQG